MIKNTLYGLIVLFTAVFTLQSCEGPMGPPGPSGQTNKMILDFQVNASDWTAILDQNNNFMYYQCIINVDEITQNIYDNAAIVPYLEVQEGDYMVQKIMPYVIENQSSYGNYTTTVDMDYSVGSVGFYVQYSDFFDSNPGPMHFRVAFIW